MRSSSTLAPALCGSTRRPLGAAAGVAAPRRRGARSRPSSGACSELRASPRAPLSAAPGATPSGGGTARARRRSAGLRPDPLNRCGRSLRTLRGGHGDVHKRPPLQAVRRPSPAGRQGSRGTRWSNGDGRTLNAWARARAPALTGRVRPKPWPVLSGRAPSSVSTLTHGCARATRAGSGHCRSSLMARPTPPRCAPRIPEVGAAAPTHRTSTRAGARPVSKCGAAVREIAQACTSSRPTTTRRKTSPAGSVLNSGWSAPRRVRRVGGPGRRLHPRKVNEGLGAVEPSSSSGRPMRIVRTGSGRSWRAPSPRASMMGRCEWSRSSSTTPLCRRSCGASGGSICATRTRRGRQRGHGLRQ